MSSSEVDWKGELERLVATASNEKDKQALESFQAAIGPYFDNPELLRTLLGKIAQSGGGGGVAVVVGKEEYKSIDELKSSLPPGVDVFGI
jgi:hypothetical protein